MLCETSLPKGTMMAISAEQAVREYLVSLRDPSALRDDDKLAKLEEQLNQTDDELDRLRLRQQILDVENPAIDGYEDRFVEHAKAWAEQAGVSEKAFLAQGVPAKVLRKAGFRNVGRGGIAQSASTRSLRRRVSADEVRASIPKEGQFTIKDVQEASGASPAVVRRVVGEEVEAGNVNEVGPDPEHSGPGRAPTLYSR